MPRRGKQLTTDQENAVEALRRVLKGRDDISARYPPFVGWDDCEAALKENLFSDEFTGSEGLSLDNEEATNALRQTIAILRVTQVYLSCLAVLNLIANLKTSNVKRRCAISLLAGMATDVGAMITLMTSGYDVQAKSIARSFGERLDMLVATQIDLALAREFFARSDIDDANRFWQRSVARGRLVKRVSNRLARLSPSSRSPIDEEWRARRADTARWLSTATHPSYLSGWFAILPDLGGRDVNIEFDGRTGLFGQPSALSIATGRSVFGRLLELWFLVQARGEHLRPKVGDIGSEIADIATNAEGFIRRVIGESYIAPHMDVWTIYYAILGYKIAPLNEESPDGQ